MIKPVSFENVDNRYNLKNVKKDVNANSFQGENLSLSNSQIGQAILNRNNISFRNLSEPIEVTDKYNKPTHGKDHLDLPNIHVYEFPDTNLQVFVNEVQNEIDKNKFQASLSLVNKGIKNDSVIKKNLLMELMNKSISRNSIEADLNEDYATFINIDLHGDISGLKQITLLNKIITEPNFSTEDLENCKKNLIKKINSKKYQQETAELKMLLDKSLLNSKETVIDNIQNITLNDISSYYSEILKNTEAQYVVTIDKNFVNNNKNLFYLMLSSNISNKFQKHSDKTVAKLPSISNKEDIKIYDDNNEVYLTLHYPVKIESNKDFLICQYLTLLEILWKAPYISDDADCKKFSLPIEMKNKDINPNSLGFLHFSFTPTGNERIFSTEQAIEVFKALLETLYSEELSSNTLESIKDFEKELYNERFSQNYDCDKTHQILQNYKGDIFKIYETIDDIKIEDIRKVMDKYLFAQNPIVIINEKKNPYDNRVQ